MLKAPAGSGSSKAGVLCSGLECRHLQACSHLNSAVALSTMSTAKRESAIIAAA